MDLTADEALDLGGPEYALDLCGRRAVEQAVDRRFDRARQLADADALIANALADDTSTRNRAVSRSTSTNEKLRDRPRGSCARPIVGRQSAGAFFVSWRPCNKWSCPSCSVDLVAECARPVLARARAGNAIYVSTIANTPTAKTSASAKARRHGADYLAVPLGDEIALYSTVALAPEAVEQSDPLVVERVLGGHLQQHAHAGGGNVSSSRSWSRTCKKDRPVSDVEWIGIARVGVVKVKEHAEKLGCAITERRDYRARTTGLSIVAPDERTARALLILWCVTPFDELERRRQRERDR